MTLIESEQSRDIPLNQIIRGPFVMRFASYRKNEDAGLDSRSEDYIVGNITTEQFLFGLCDGVGSSYYGNIGSQFLGETIHNWLCDIKLPSLDMSENNLNEWLEKLKIDLKNELDTKAEIASYFIQKKELAHGNELVQLAEKSQREDFGTQSNFVGGVLWPKSNKLPNGLAIFFWLGNARLRIFKEISDGNFEDVTYLTSWGKNSEQLREVWSSKEGVVGEIYSFITDFSKITKIIAYSDGLETVESEIVPNLNATNLDAIVSHAQKLKDDDISYLEISLSKIQNSDFTDDIVEPIRHLYYSDTKKESEEQYIKEKEILKEKVENYIIEISALKKKNKRLMMVFMLSITAIAMVIISGLLLGYIFRDQIKNGFFNQQETIITIEPSLPILPPTRTFDTPTSTEQGIPSSTITPGDLIEETPFVTATP